MYKDTSPLAPWVRRLWGMHHVLALHRVVTSVIKFVLASFSSPFSIIHSPTRFYWDHLLNKLLLLECLSRGLLFEKPSKWNINIQEMTCCSGGFVPFQWCNVSFGHFSGLIYECCLILTLYQQQPAVTTNDLLRNVLIHNLLWKGLKVTLNCDLQYMMSWHKSDAQWILAKWMIYLIYTYLDLLAQKSSLIYYKILGNILKMNKTFIFPSSKKFWFILFSWILFTEIFTLI